MTYIGIDPGVSGGIAMVDDISGQVKAVPMPSTDRDILDLLTNGFSQPHVTVRAVLEFVRSSPQMGVVSAFKFGQGYGGLKMALAAARIPYDEVTPQKWQRSMQCLTKGDKNVSKRRAQELFPSMKVTHAIADALLLAEYARRTEVRI